MAKPIAFGDVSLDVNAGRQALAEEEPIKLRPDPEDPFRILILGNFSGRGAGNGKPIAIDRDNMGGFAIATSASGAEAWQ